MPEISNRIKSAVGILVTLLIYLALLPTVVTQVQVLNTTSWLFTGATGAIVLIGIVPFVFVASILLLIVSDTL